MPTIQELVSQVSRGFFRVQNAVSWTIISTKIMKSTLTLFLVHWKSHEQLRKHTAGNHWTNIKVVYKLNFLK